MIGRRRVFIVWLVFVVCGLGLRAQDPDAVEGGEQDAVDSRDPLPLIYAGEVMPQNQLFTNWAVETVFDDNVFNSNSYRQSDTGLRLGPQVGLVENHRQLKLAIDYRPYLLLYRKAAEYDQFNQFMDVDAHYRLSARLSLRIRDDFGYFAAGVEGRFGAPAVPNFAARSSLNETTLTPLARTEQNTARADALYQISDRGAVDIFAGSLDRKFSHLALTSRQLLGADGLNGGVEYSHQLSQFNTFAASYVVEDLRFGPQLRALAQTALFSYSFRPSGTVTVSVFGGPELTRLYAGTAIKLSGGPASEPTPVAGSRWSPTLGGSLRRQSKTMVIRISSQRLVSDGGGFLGAAINSAAGLDLRRRLSAELQAVVAATWARTSSIGPRSSESIHYLNLQLGLERQLRERFTAHLGYEYIRQRSGRELPLQVRADADRVSFGIFYRMAVLPLGR